MSLMLLKTLKKQFLNHLKNDKGRSEKTLENYNRYLEHFLWISRLKTAEELGVEPIKKFITELEKTTVFKEAAAGDNQEQKLSAKTINYHLIALRQFLRYLRERGLVDLPTNLIALKTTTKQATVLTLNDDELSALKNVIDQKTPAGRQEFLLLELMTKAGLKTVELCQLKRGDFDDKTGKLTLSGQAREIDLPASVSRKLHLYLRQRADADSALFVRFGRKSRVGQSKSITPRYLERVVKRLALKAGIAKSVTPQVLRHTFANNLLQSGVEIKTLQTALGHSKESVTRAYVKKLAGGES